MLNQQTMRHRVAPMQATAGLAWLAALVLIAWAWQLSLQRAAAAAALAALHAQQSEVPTTSSAITQQHNFIHHLPSANTLPSRAHTLIETSQRDAAARGVQLLAVTSAPQPASERGLAKWDVSLTLQGSYPQVKAVLSQAVARTPPVVIRRIELRRAANGNDVEAELALMLIGRPVPGSER